jgi:hypothetical protein
MTGRTGQTLSYSPTNVQHEAMLPLHFSPIAPRSLAAGQFRRRRAVTFVTFGMVDGD